MKNTLLPLFLLALGLSAFAQETPKASAFVGFQAIHAARSTQGAAVASITGDFSPRAGLTAQFSVLPASGGTGYAVMFGPTIYPVGHQKVSPFVQALGGFAFASSGGSLSPAYFAASVGGGAEVAVGPRFMLRGGVDWLRVRAAGSIGASGARVYIGVGFNF